MKPFDPEEFWRDKKYKCWVVILSTGEGKRMKMASYNIQARTAERAIIVAKKHCTVLTGRIDGYARLASPEDLGAR